MISSMTGFGRFEGQVNGRTITLEIKSVNHRYTEFSCRTTKGYSFLEEKLKSFLAPADREAVLGGDGKGGGQGGDA